MRIGVDIDGVLANFNDSFISTIIEVTGRDLFPERPFDIPTWYYPEFYGYTKEEMDFVIGSVWKAVKANETFWQNLKPYPTTLNDLRYLVEREDSGDEVYYITDRAGITPKFQTEMWFLGQDGTDVVPTVLISGMKGLCAKALKLDVYIDDKWENILNVIEMSPNTRVFILDRPWNRGHDDVEAQYGIERVYCVEGICERAA